MCGICGIVGHPDPGVLRRMREKLVHRGPDDAGEHLDGEAGLGFRRLSIIDLKTGAQPMRGCRPIWIVFNGEIYNYRELRAGLTGHSFRTASDTEVILHLYEEKGADCVRDLNGMFAFAIWDEEKRTLFAARDRFGKKPFVYHAGREFIFASEIAPLLEHPGIPRRLDRQALAEYLAYLCVPSPRTMLADVRKLPPAHWLVWDGKLTLRRYWEPSVASGDGDENFEEKIRASLTEAVRRRLVADVPIGAFLSGGIDSTIVVGLMSKIAGEVRTFSIGFEEWSELPYARAAAERFKTNHQEFVVRPDAMEVLPTLIERYGEPFGDSSSIPTYYVARETARHVKVALSGDGGDENFAGYLRHEAIAKLARLRKWPASILKMASLFFPSSTGRGDRIRRLLQSAKRPLADLYVDLMTFFTPEMRAELGIEGEVKARVAHPFEAHEADPITAAGFTDLVTYLPDDILVKVDIASMANGLEVRCPFLDPEVVALAFQLPGRVKRRKSILKRAFKDLLPAAIMKRGKMGFGIPLAQWLRGPLRPLMEDTLLGRAARERGVFAPAAVEKMVKEHLFEKRDHRDRLWLLLVFELWARRFMS